jgi:hypothetical protein
MGGIDRIPGTGPLRATGPLDPRLVPQAPAPAPQAPAAPNAPADQLGGDAAAVMAALQARDAAVAQHLQAAEQALQGDATSAFMNALGLGHQPASQEQADVAEQGATWGDRLHTLGEKGEQLEGFLRRITAAAPAAGEASRPTIAQFPHPHEGPNPGVWTGLMGLGNAVSGGFGMYGAAQQVQHGQQELAEGDVLHGTADVVGGDLSFAASTATLGQGGLELASVGSRLLGGAAGTTAALGTGAEILGNVAGPLAAGAGVITGGIHMVDALNANPPNYGEAAVGGLQAVAGVAMCFPPVGTVINLGCLAYEHWDQITHVAAEVGHAVAHVEEAVEHAVADVAHMFGL